MNTLLMLATILTLPYAGEVGWASDPTRTCLYKLPGTSRFYFVTLPVAEPCPKQVELRIDDPEPTAQDRATRYAL